MKRNLILVSAIVLATLTSCTKDSELDPTIESAMNAQIPISFSTYASSATATKGTAIDSNDAFQKKDGTHGSFDVAALASECEYELDYGEDTSDAAKIDSFTMSATSDGVKFFSLNTLTYDESWVSTTNMYWPNSSRVMHFAACSPSGVIEDDKDYTFEYDYDALTSNYTYSFDYTVTDDIAKQIDLMYALTSVNYLSPSDQENKSGLSYITSGYDSSDNFGDTNVDAAVNLHFKHALTQIAFSATKDSNIIVYVKGISICNVYNSGTFTATTITDDSDSSANQTDSNTVGDDTDDTGDLVNADNFGSWIIDFDDDGWGTVYDEDSNTSGTLTTLEIGTDEAARTNYYTTEGSGGHASMSNYAAPFTSYNANSPAAAATTGDNNSILILDSETPTALTSSTDVLMLIPQSLKPWVPTASTEPNYAYSIYDNDTATKVTNNQSSTGTNSLTYLAIDCEIYNSGADTTNDTGVLHDGYLFVPFETSDIDYTTAKVDSPETDDAIDAWLPGYKITYCIHFGDNDNMYIVDEDNHTSLPEPGCIPDTDTYTLRDITYTTTIDTFVPSESADEDI